MPSSSRPATTGGAPTSRCGRRRRSSRCATPAATATGRIRAAVSSPPMSAASPAATSATTGATCIATGGRRSAESSAMKWIGAIGLALPLAAQATMGPDDARHLLNRTGFGAQPREIAEYAALSRSEAVERLLAGMTKSARTPPPEWVRTAIVPPRQLRQAPPEERKAFQAEEIRRGFDLRTWWVEEMLQTRSPLTERLTLFWHNHFVSSQQKGALFQADVRAERPPPAARGRQL